MTSTETQDAIRLDIWLWHTRMFKTRALAGRVVSQKGARITRFGRTDKTTKPSFGLRPGDIVTFSRNKEICVLEVVALGDRRGPAAEAQTLYKDITPRDFSS